jgi:predicted esterase
MFFLTSFLITASLSFIQPHATQAEPATLLRNAVGLKSQDLRATAALRLAKKRIPLEQWIECMQDFGEFEIFKSGRHSLRAKLWVEGQQITRQLELYVPSAYDISKPSPLLLLLHGSGASGKQMLPGWQRLAEQQGYLLVAPTALNSTKGYSFSQAERQTALEALRWIRLRFNVDENRIHLHGVSRGAHLTWDLGLRYPDRFASLIPAIGGPTWVIGEGRNNMRYIENLWDMPIRDLQGSQDDYKLLRNLRRCFERLEAIGNANAHLREFEGLGHNFRTDTIDWAGFIDNSDRTPLPKRILLRATRADKTRNAWLRIDKVDRNVKEIFPLTVKPGLWEKLDEDEKARFVQDLADSKTGQVDAERMEDGSFQIKMNGIKQVSLMLPMEWIPKSGRVLVANSKGTQSLKAKSSTQVLLLDFVERFDRTVLPTCAVTVKQ